MEKRSPRLFLHHHGNTDWSDSRRHTGRTNVPLNTVGEEHARLLGERLIGERFTRVFASPLIRVRRTCELAEFAEHAEITSDLTEWDYGNYEGLLSSDVHRTRPDWNLYRDGTPGGESPEQVAARTDRFIDFIRPLDGDIAAFSSAQIIRMIAALWLGLSPSAARYFHTDTASIGILSYEYDRIQPVLHLWNDVGTLNSNT